MARTTVTLRLNVLAPTDLPAAGSAKLVAGAEFFQAVRPAGVSANGWRYSLFGSYGSGLFNPYYSTKGAYVLAGTGGHSHPATFGAFVFNFDTMQPEYLPAVNAPPDRDGPVYAAETSGDPWWEMNGYPECPSPPHPYKTQLVIPPGLGGSAKGSMVYIQRSSVDSGGVTHSPTVHAFDLVTRTWARRSSTTGLGAGYERAAVHDPVTNRYYVLRADAHYLNSLPYIDGADWTLKNTVTWPWENAIPPGVIGDFICPFIHESGGVRALMAITKSSLSALDLDNPAAGWSLVPLAGAALELSTNTPAYHAAQNKYYRRYGNQTDQVLQRITPPSGNPITGTWTVDTVTLAGDPIPGYQNYYLVGGSVDSNRTLMYVPALQMLAWITAGGVALLNP